MIPIGLTFKENTIASYLALSLMLGSFFVNAAGLFYLSAILEKNIHVNRIFIEINLKHLQTNI